MERTAKMNILQSKLMDYAPDVTVDFAQFEARQKQGKKRLVLFVLILGVALLSATVVMKLTMNSKSYNIKHAGDLNLGPSIVSPSAEEEQDQEAQEQSIDYELVKEASIEVVPMVLEVHESQQREVTTFENSLLSRPFKGFPIEVSRIYNMPFKGCQSAQEESKNRWSIDFQVGSMISEQSVNLNTGADRYIHDAFPDVWNSTVNVAWSWNVQSRLHYDLTRNISMHTGLGLGESAVNGRYKFTLDSVPVYDLDKTIAGYVTVNDSARRNIDLGSASQRFNQLRIPLGMSYNSQFKGYTLRLHAGVEWTWAFNSQGNTLNAYNLLEANDIKTVLNPTGLNYYGGLEVTKPLFNGADIGLSFNQKTRVNSLHTAEHYNASTKMYTVSLLYRYKL